LTAKSGQTDTKSSQEDGLTYDQWLAVLAAAFAEPGSDNYKSLQELRELTGLTHYMIEKRLRQLLKEGKVTAAKAHRKGPTGFLQKVYVYGLVEKKSP